MTSFTKCNVPTLSPMQRIINDPNLVVEDMLKGFAKCYKNLISPIEENPRVLKYIKAPIPGKVGVVTGGGSGHKPAFVGYVGKNMCDAVAVGEVFASPSAQVFFDAFKAANGGAGIACLYGNYAGDNMNVKMAKQLAALEAIEVKTVVANDDVASAPKQEPQNRRGLAGEGVMVSALKSADEIASLAMDHILQDLPFQAGDNVVALVSGLGATPVMELYIAYSKAYDILEEAKINVHRSYVGNYFTSLEMMGITFTLMKVDDELKALIDVEAESMGLTQLGH